MSRMLSAYVLSVAYHIWRGDEYTPSWSRPGGKGEGCPYLGPVPAGGIPVLGPGWGLPHSPGKGPGIRDNPRENEQAQETRVPLSTDERTDRCKHNLSSYNICGRLWNLILSMLQNLRKPCFTHVGIVYIIFIV